MLITGLNQNTWIKNYVRYYYENLSLLYSRRTVLAIKFYIARKQGIIFLGIPRMVIINENKI